MIEVSRGQKETGRKIAAESWQDGVRAPETEMTKTDSRPPQSDIYSTAQIQHCKNQPEQEEAWRQLAQRGKRHHFERPSRPKLDICCQRTHQCFTAWHSELNLTLLPWLIFLCFSRHTHTQQEHTLAVIKDPKKSSSSVWICKWSHRWSSDIPPSSLHFFAPLIFIPLLIILASKLQWKKTLMLSPMPTFSISCDMKWSISSIGRTVALKGAVVANP